MATRRSSRGEGADPQDVRGQGSHQRFRRGIYNNMNAAGAGVRENLPSEGGLRDTIRRGDERHGETINWVERELSRIWNQLSGHPSRPAEYDGQQIVGPSLPEMLDASGGIINFARDGVSVPLRHPYDYSNTEVVAFAPNSQRRSGALTALNACPAIIFDDTAGPESEGMMAKPGHWTKGYYTFDQYWTDNAATASTDDVVLEFRPRYSLPDGTYNNDIFALTTQVVQVATQFAWQKVTWISGLIDLTAADFLHWRTRRLGTNGSDTYTGDIYYLGGKLTYTPERQTT